MDIKNLEEAAIVAMIVAASCLVLVATTPKQRRWWVRPWILKRDTRGSFRLVNQEFEECGDKESFQNFLRMDKETFEKLLGFVESDIRKESTHLRETISARNRLIVTLRFLATGESFQSLQYYFRMGKSTISTIVPEVCKAIYKTLKPMYMTVPSSAADWLNIAAEFEKKWNLPNIVGAMDGKHIVFRAPRQEGSSYFNYKQQHSIVLLAVVDAQYKFTYIDCGTNGRVSDGGVFHRSDLSNALEQNTLNFPEDRPLPGRRRLVPFVIVADAAFPLKTNIMKPFPYRNMTWIQRVFNYRLSRVRRVVENAFGILANKWRVLLTPINLCPDKVQLITLTCCVLHNFLLSERPYPVDADPDIDQDFTFRYGLVQQAGNRARGEAIAVRNEFMEYVNNEGAVPWQNDLV